MTKRSDLESRLNYQQKNLRAWSRIWISQHAERARRPDNPAHLRLADLAIALAPANGHANVKEGELAGFLGVTARIVDTEIALAVSYGLLAPGSKRRCLILPHGVDGLCIRRDPNARMTEQEQPCAVCHAERPARPATCCPHKPVHALGLCQAHYRAKRRAESGTNAA